MTDGLNKNTGTTDATLSVDRFGNAYNSYLFNGVSSKMILTAHEITNMQYSYSMWFKPLALPISNTYYQLLTIGNADF